jgi:hypothetical protein
MKFLEFTQILNKLSKDSLGIIPKREVLDCCYGEYKKTEHRINTTKSISDFTSMLDYYQTDINGYKEYARSNNITEEEAFLYLTSIELAVLESKYYIGD